MSKELMRIGQEAIPAIDANVSAPAKIHCLDCGGWPIEGGAVFIPVAHCKDGAHVSVLREPQKGHFTPFVDVGFICELCFVWRLQRRADIVSRTSTPKGYYAFTKAKRDIRDAIDRQHGKRVGSRFVPWERGGE